VGTIEGFLKSSSLVLTEHQCRVLASTWHKELALEKVYADCLLVNVRVRVLAETLDQRRLPDTAIPHNDDLQ
jgi:hypothetical protein